MSGPAAEVRVGAGGLQLRLATTSSGLSTVATIRTQRLLNRAVWDTFAAMGIVRRFAVAGLDEAAHGAGPRVGALDETGQEKKGT
jgi:hypothetical protein